MSNQYLSQSVFSNMIPKYTTIQVSATTYWGFKMHIETEKLLVMNKKEIIEKLIEVMKTFFYEHNLMELAEGVDNLNLHIYQNILENPIYACEHKHKND